LPALDNAAVNDNQVLSLQKTRAASQQAIGTLPYAPKQSRT